MRSLQRTKTIDSVLLAGTLGAGFYAQQEPLLMTAAYVVAMALLGHYRDQKEAEDRVQESRGYFYWDVTRKAKKRRL